MNPRGQVVHALPGRLRLRIPEHRNEPDYFAALEEQLGGCPGVTALRSNHRTGSVLVHHDPGHDMDAILRWAAEHGLFTTEGQPAPSPTLRAVAQRGLARLDLRLLDQSGGTTDTPSLLMVVLLVLTLVQAARGQVLGSASTMLWYAFTLMRDQRGPSSAGGD